MIKVENRQVVIKGNTFSVIDEFYVVLCAFRECTEKDLGQEGAKKFLFHMFETMYMTNEEIDALNEKDKREHPEISALAEIVTILTERGGQDGE